VVLRPLGTSATNWPIVPAPDDRWWWLWSSRWNENWQGKPKYSERAYPSATLSTTNPAWPHLGSNPGNRGGKPAANRLSYGAAFVKVYCAVCVSAPVLLCDRHSNFEPTKQFPLNLVRMAYHWRPPKRRRLDFPHQCPKIGKNMVKARTCRVGALLVSLSTGFWHDGWK
jgi:hypothetical protein